MSSNKTDIEIPGKILDNWQEIANLLAQIVGIPSALIMRFTDPDIEVFVSSDSADNPYRPGDKETMLGSGLYCERVIETRDKLQVPDALADENWKHNPDVKLNMISYLGFPILLPDNSPFGTICVLDNKANEFSEMIEQLMLKFRGQIESHLELIYMNHVLGDRNKRLKDYLMEIQVFRGFVPICAHCKSIRDDQNEWHPIEHYLIRHPEAEFSHGICPKCEKEYFPKTEGNSEGA